MSEQLIQRWLTTSDKQAGEAIYQAHYKRVFRLAYALLGDVNDAEQVMQDTLTYALTRIKLFDQQQMSFTTWLHTIAVSRCRDRARRKHLPGNPAGNAGSKTAQATNSHSEPVVIAQEGHQEIWQALDRLSLKLREAIVLYYWGGHTYQELAEILHCPLSTAQSRVRVAYEQLYKLHLPVGM
jgi:RNA polymerase sigma-70 factor (ECF subfamily)